MVKKEELDRFRPLTYFERHSQLKKRHEMLPVKSQPKREAPIECKVNIVKL